MLVDEDLREDKAVNAGRETEITSERKETSWRESTRLRSTADRKTHARRQRRRPTCVCSDERDDDELDSAWSAPALGLQRG
jgi:hypothetical protein